MVSWHLDVGVSVVDEFEEETDAVEALSVLGGLGVVGLCEKVDFVLGRLEVYGCALEMDCDASVSFVALTFC